MSITFNMDSILGKAKAYMSGSTGQQKMRTTADAIMLGNAKPTNSGAMTHSVEEAGEKMAQVLKRTIESSGLSSGVASALYDVSCGEPYRLSGNRYGIAVGFPDFDLSRPSLQQGRYGSVSNLAALYNNGVDHAMNPVYGEWHGERIRSKTVIPGLHFMQRAVDDFGGNYGYEYNVMDIKLDDIYN